MAVCCYLVRHGQDDPSIRGGWTDTGLVALGEKQASALAERFRPLRGEIHHVYSSDLRRAMETAEPIAQALELEVVKKPRLREVNNGVLAGMDNRQALQQYPGLFWARMRWDQQYPGGESPGQFYNRIRDAIGHYLEDLASSGESAVIVTHGAVISLVLDLVCGIRYTNKQRHHWIPCGSVVKLEYQRGVWVMQQETAD